MKRIIGTYRGEMMQSRGDAFYTLARSIVGQQISVKAADSVWNKLATGGSILPKSISAREDADLRACGLSGQKVLYLREIAGYFVENKVKKGYFESLSDEEVIRQLTSIKGVGKWTAEMFLMFHLMRPDVFPVDDIGLQKGLLRHYEGLSPAQKGVKSAKKEFYTQMVAMAEPWRPYRSVATWYLWRSLDPVPVEY